MNTLFRHQPPKLLQVLDWDRRPGQMTGEVSGRLRNFVLLDEVNVQELKLSLDVIFVTGR